MRIRECFDVILLDMNRTFMFGADRFEEHENFFDTYTRLGGKNLSELEVDSAIRACFEGMLTISRDRARFDSFISVAEGLQEYGGLKQPASDDIPLLVDVFAEHEVGTVPRDFALYLQDLSLTHKLGLVSNIWDRDRYTSVNRLLDAPQSVFEP